MPTEDTTDTFLAWTTADKVYDYWYVTRTGLTKESHGRTWHQVEVSDRQRWEGYQVPRYNSGLEVAYEEGTDNPFE